MSFASLFSSKSVRFKIYLSLVPALLPMLAIALVGFLSHRESTVHNSERIMGLILENGTSSVNTYLANQTGAFREWTAEDIWGMSIEYDIVGDLPPKFAEMTAAAPDFALVVLTDAQGTILAGGKSGSGELGALLGQQTSDTAIGAGADGMRVKVANSQTLANTGAAHSTTFIYCNPVQSSTGEVAGYLIGYLDWSQVQKNSQQVTDQLVASGFPDAAAAVVANSNGNVLAWSSADPAEGKPQLSGDSVTWLNGASNAGEVSLQDVRDGAHYAGFAPLTDPGGAPVGAQSIVVMVPEGNVLAHVIKILRFNFLIAAAGIVLLSLSFWFLARNITLPLRAAIDSLSRSSGEIRTASQQVNMASEEIADGASNQAAGLEETSASIVSLSSLTADNTEKAQQASGIASETHTAAESSRVTFEKLTETINRIQSSSAETAKILKTIDEIAFQTNLLALNAAVEAARAGDAGRGFAVVAEEVRNLAQRSAEAAQSTAGLIVDNQKNSSDGVAVVTEANQTLQQIIDSVNDVNNLVEEVAAASNDQSDRIGATKNAVIQIESVTQKNAASSEESAAASRELASQAETLESLVQVLQGIIDGGSTGGSTALALSAADTANEIEAVEASTWDQTAGSTGQSGREMDPVYEEIEL